MKKVEYRNRNGLILIYGDFVEDIEKENSILKFENCEIIDIDHEYIALEPQENCSRIWLNNSIGEIDEIIFEN